MGSGALQRAQRLCHMAHDGLPHPGTIRSPAVSIGLTEPPTVGHLVGEGGPALPGRLLG
jgi:hypothetical protein